ncbi:MAG: hypothetical protein WA129_13040 [Acidovorax sp.]
MTKTRSIHAMAAVAGVALALLAGAGTAQARDVYWSVGVNSPGVALGASNGGYPVYVAPAPVYVAPQPIYYQPPPPVYYAPPRPVYYAPAVMVGAPVYGGYYRGGGHGHWRGNDGGHGHWRGNDGGRGGWGRHGHRD